MSIALFLMLAAFPAQAGPAFTPGTAADFARRRSAVTDDRADDAADRVRVALIVNPPAAAELMPTADRAVLEAAVGRIDRGSATGMSWFLRSVVTVATDIGEVRRIAWYNPIVDIALVGSWRRIDGRWRLVAAALADGAALRGTPGQPSWSELAGISCQYAFATRAVAGAEALARALTARADYSLLARGVTTVERSLAALRADPAASASAAAVVRALADARPRAIAPAQAPSAAMVQALPEGVRHSLAVVGAYARGEGWLLLVASPLRGDLFFFVDLDGQARPTLIAPVNLANRPLERR